MSTTIATWSAASASQSFRLCAWQVDNGFESRFEVVFDDGNYVDKTWHDTDEAGFQRRMRGFEGVLVIQGLRMPARVPADVDGDPTSWAEATRPCPPA